MASTFAAGGLVHALSATLKLAPGDKER